MKMMIPHNMITRIPNTIPHDEDCKGCIFGNHHQDPFDVGKAWCAQDQLELVHIDLC